jgi:hypothetical protein
MTDLTLPTEIQRIEQILEVTRLRAKEALTLREACDLVGIPTITYSSFRNTWKTAQVFMELLTMLPRNS